MPITLEAAATLAGDVRSMMCKSLGAITETTPRVPGARLCQPRMLLSAMIAAVVLVGSAARPEPPNCERFAYAVPIL